jgi:glucose-6-phosphate isomerase
VIKLDFTNILNEKIGSEGIAYSEIEKKVSEAVSTFLKRPYNELGFLELPHQDLSDLKELAKKAKDYDYFLLLGIGGSALGPKVILDALSPFHNLRKSPKVFIYDNVDPVTFKYILDSIDLKKTLINVVSKSGSTAETLAPFMILWKMIKDRQLALREHFVFTTDPQKGNLRRIAKDYEITCLNIPQNVGGRYSVLSPVGLFLAEVIGQNSEEFLEGAKYLTERAKNSKLEENPMAVLAVSLFLLDKLNNRKIVVFLPYSDRLRMLSEWFCQLWAESLGKEGRGTTPYPSVGTTDQHSQLQMWMEGPEDKVILFLSVDDHGIKAVIPEEFTEIEGLKYLGGHSLEELLETEQLAVEMALTINKKPNLKIILPKITPYYLGQVFQFLQIATAMAGFLYEVNPFNQPGVELGKRLTYGAMGRRGFEQEGEEVKNYLKWKRLIV